MKPLEIRKQILIAEAEILRARIVEDIYVVRCGAKGIRRQARSIGAIASVVALVVAGFNAFKHPRSNGVAPGKSSLLSRLFSGARVATGVWSALRSQRK
jgi:hypothetical protein